MRLRYALNTTARIVMDAFTQMTHDWVNFFSALAQVSGALVGLVFVALTFNAKKLGVGGDPMLGALARQTFADFVLLLFVSMLMLAPHVQAPSVGMAMLLFATVGTLRLAWSLSRLRAHFRRWKLLQRFILSFVGQLAVGAAGVELMRGDMAVVGSLLFSGSLSLMISGCRSAWMLVVLENPPLPGETEQRLDPGKAPHQDDERE